MVFVCPPQENAEAMAQMAASVKETLQQIDNQLNVGVKPICVPCCMPLCNYPASLKEAKTEAKTKFDPPQVMVCYREPSNVGNGKQNVVEKEENVIRLQQSKSRELRASILYTGCQCEKRDGLQDDCPRTGCQGSPDCLTSPPTCGPSEFCDGKHLGKNNRYSYLKQKSNGSTRNGKGHGDAETYSASYKCYAATVDQPIVIPLTSTLPCCPCPP